MIKNKSDKLYRCLLAITIIVYGYLLLSIVLFKTLESPMDLLTGNHPDYRSLNLIPFQDMWNSNLSASSNKTSIIGNIILFVPLGVFLKLSLSEQKLNPLKSILIVLASSLLIETIQYIARIGVSDINDVILNTAGGMIGILLSSILLRWMGRAKALKVVAVLGAVVAVMMIGLEAILFIVN